MGDPTVGDPVPSDAVQITGLGLNQTTVITLLSGTLIIGIGDSQVRYSTTDDIPELEEGDFISLEPEPLSMAGDSVASISYPTSSTTSVTAPYVVTYILRDLVVDDCTPEGFEFVPIDGYDPGALATSGTVAVLGINVACPIYVVGTQQTELYIDGVQIPGPPRSVGDEVVVLEGQSVYVTVPTLSDYSTSITVTVVVGTIEAPFTATTRAADREPDPFPMTRITGANTATHHDSNVIVIRGIEVNVRISTTLGIIHSTGPNNPVIASHTLISNGDSFFIRIPASTFLSTDPPGSSYTAHVTAGTRTESFTVVTSSVADSDPFRVGNLVNVDRGTTFVLEPIFEEAGDSTDDNEVSGLGTGNTATLRLLGVDVPDENFRILINGTTPVDNSYKTNTSMVTVEDDDTLAINVTTPNTYSTRWDFTLAIGGTNTGFSVVTEPAPPPPPPRPPITFPSITGASLNTIYSSNTITVSGLEDDEEVEASISGGVGAMIIESGGSLSFVDAPNTAQVQNGDTIFLQRRSSTQYSTTVITILSVGGVSGSWSITTRAFTGQVARVLYDVVAAQFPTSVSNGVADVRVDASGGDINLSGFTISGSRYLVLSIPNSLIPIHLYANYEETNQVDLLSSLSVSPYIINGSRDGWSIDLTGSLSDLSPRLMVGSSDRTPNQFRFQDRDGLDRSTEYDTNEITLSGFTSPLRISTSEGTIFKNGSDSTFEDSISTSALVTSGDRIKIRVRTRSGYSASTNVTVGCGGDNRHVHLHYYARTYCPWP